MLLLIVIGNFFLYLNFFFVVIFYFFVLFLFLFVIIIIMFILILFMEKFYCFFLDFKFLYWRFFLIERFEKFLNEEDVWLFVFLWLDRMFLLFELDFFLFKLFILFLIFVFFVFVFFLVLLFGSLMCFLLVSLVFDVSSEKNEWIVKFVID